MDGLSRGEANRPAPSDWQAEEYAWDSRRLVATRQDTAAGDAQAEDEGSDEDVGEPMQGDAQTDLQPAPNETCMVKDCSVDLSSCKAYYRRFRICERHLKTLSLCIEGKLSRFCQQCGRFHGLEEFEGSKRSCRRALLTRFYKRRNMPVPLDVLPTAADNGPRQPAKDADTKTKARTPSSSEPNQLRRKRGRPRAPPIDVRDLLSDEPRTAFSPHEQRTQQQEHDEEQQVHVECEQNNGRGGGLGTGPGGGAGLHSTGGPPSSDTSSGGGSSSGCAGASLPAAAALHQLRSSTTTLRCAAPDPLESRYSSGSGVGAGAQSHSIYSSQGQQQHQPRYGGALHAQQQQQQHLHQQQQQHLLQQQQQLRQALLDQVQLQQELEHQQVMQQQQHQAQLAGLPQRYLAAASGSDAAGESLNRLQRHVMLLRQSSDAAMVGMATGSAGTAADALDLTMSEAWQLGPSWAYGGDGGGGVDGGSGAAAGGGAMGRLVQLQGGTVDPLDLELMSIASESLMSAQDLPQHGALPVSTSKAAADVGLVLGLPHHRELQPPSQQHRHQRHHHHHHLHPHQHQQQQHRQYQPLQLNLGQNHNNHHAHVLRLDAEPVGLSRSAYFDGGLDLSRGGGGGSAMNSTAAAVRGLLDRTGPGAGGGCDGEVLNLGHVGTRNSLLGFPGGTGGAAAVASGGFPGVLDARDIRGSGSGSELGGGGGGSHANGLNFTTSLRVAAAEGGGGGGGGLFIKAALPDFGSSSSNNINNINNNALALGGPSGRSGLDSVGLRFVNHQQQQQQAGVFLLGRQQQQQQQGMVVGGGASLRGQAGLRTLDLTTVRDSLLSQQQQQPNMTLQYRLLQQQQQYHRHQYPVLSLQQQLQQTAASANMAPHLKEAAQSLLAQGGPRATYTPSSTVLERLNLKIHQRRPDDLPANLAEHLADLLSNASASVLQGSIRPGCTHLVLDVLCEDRERLAAALLGPHGTDPGAAAERIVRAVLGQEGMGHDCRLHAQFGDALLVIHGDKAQFRRRAVAASPSPGHEPPPAAAAQGSADGAAGDPWVRQEIIGVAPLAVVAGHELTLEVLGCGLKLSGTTFHVRFRGRHLDVMPEFPDTAPQCGGNSASAAASAAVGDLVDPSLTSLAPDQQREQLHLGPQAQQWPAPHSSAMAEAARRVPGAQTEVAPAPEPATRLQSPTPTTSRCETAASTSFSAPSSSDDNNSAAAATTGRPPTSASRAAAAIVACTDGAPSGGSMLRSGECCALAAGMPLSTATEPYDNGSNVHRQGTRIVVQCLPPLAARATIPEVPPLFVRGPAAEDLLPRLLAMGTPPEVSSVPYAVGEHWAQGCCCSQAACCEVVGAAEWGNNEGFDSKGFTASPGQQEMSGGGGGCGGGGGGGGGCGGGGRRDGEDRHANGGVTHLAAAAAGGYLETCGAGGVHDRPGGWADEETQHCTASPTVAWMLDSALFPERLFARLGSSVVPYTSRSSVLAAATVAAAATTGGGQLGAVLRHGPLEDPLNMGSRMYGSASDGDGGGLSTETYISDIGDDEDMDRPSYWPYSFSAASTHALRPDMIVLFVEPPPRGGLVLVEAESPPPPLPLPKAQASAHSPSCQPAAVAAVAAETSMHLNNSMSNSMGSGDSSNIRSSVGGGGGGSGVGSGSTAASVVTSGVLSEWWPLVVLPAAAAQAAAEINTLSGERDPAWLRDFLVDFGLVLEALDAEAAAATPPPTAAATTTAVELGARRVSSRTAQSGRTAAHNRAPAPVGDGGGPARPEQCAGAVLQLENDGAGRSPGCAASSTTYPGDVGATSPYASSATWGSGAEVLTQQSTVDGSIAWTTPDIDRGTGCASRAAATPSAATVRAMAQEELLAGLPEALRQVAAGPAIAAIRTRGSLAAAAAAIAAATTAVAAPQVAPRQQQQTSEASACGGGGEAAAAGGHWYSQRPRPTLTLEPCSTGALPARGGGGGIRCSGDGSVVNWMAMTPNGALTATPAAPQPLSDPGPPRWVREEGGGGGGGLGGVAMAYCSFFGSGGHAKESPGFESISPEARGGVPMAGGLRSSSSSASAIPLRSCTAGGTCQLSETRDTAPPRSLPLAELTASEAARFFGFTVSAEISCEEEPVVTVGSDGGSDSGWALDAAAALPATLAMAAPPPAAALAPTTLAGGGSGHQCTAAQGAVAAATLTAPQPQGQEQEPRLGHPPLKDGAGLDSGTIATITAAAAVAAATAAAAARRERVIQLWRARQWQELLPRARTLLVFFCNRGFHHCAGLVMAFLLRAVGVSSTLAEAITCLSEHSASAFAITATATPGLATQEQLCRLPLALNLLVQQVRSETGIGLLHHAVRSGSVETVGLVLRVSCRMDAPFNILEAGPDGVTPAHLAAILPYNSIAIMKSLVAHATFMATRTQLCDSALAFAEAAHMPCGCDDGNLAAAIAASPSSAPAVPLVARGHVTLPATVWLPGGLPPPTVPVALSPPPPPLPLALSSPPPPPDAPAAMLSSVRMPMVPRIRAAGKPWEYEAAPHVAGGGAMPGDVLDRGGVLAGTAVGSGDTLTGPMGTLLPLHKSLPGGVVSFGARGGDGSGGGNAFRLSLGSGSSRQSWQASEERLASARCSVTEYWSDALMDLRPPHSPLLLDYAARPEGASGGWCGCLGSAKVVVAVTVAAAFLSSVGLLDQVHGVSTATVLACFTVLFLSWKGAAAATAVAAGGRSGDRVR